jgi:hypothetical protein
MAFTSPLGVASSGLGTNRRLVQQVRIESECDVRLHGLSQCSTSAKYNTVLRIVYRQTHPTVQGRRLRSGSDYFEVGLINVVAKMPGPRSYETVAAWGDDARRVRAPSLPRSFQCLKRAAVPDHIDGTSSAIRSGTALVLTVDTRRRVQ